MLPVFLFGVIAIPYVGYSVRSYGEVAWKMLVLKIFTPKYQDVFDKHTYESESMSVMVHSTEIVIDQWSVLNTRSEAGMLSDLLHSIYMLCIEFQLTRRS